MKLVNPWFVVCIYEGEEIASIYGPFPSQDDALIYQIEIDNSSNPCDNDHLITDKEPPLNFRVHMPITKTEHMYDILAWMDERALRELAFKGYPLS